MKKNICLAAAGLLVFATTSYAGQNMMKMDTDKDGKISRAEATEKMAQRFDQMDTNKDGFITQDELQKLRDGKKNKDKKGMKMDKDQDGKISRSEASGKLATHFDAIDANKDGFLTKDELKDARKKQKELAN